MGAPGDALDAGLGEAEGVGVEDELGREEGTGEELAVGVPAVADDGDDHDPIVVEDPVDDPVAPDTRSQMPPVLAPERANPGEAARVRGQLLKALVEAPLKRGVGSVEEPARGPSEYHAVHVSTSA